MRKYRIGTRVVTAHDMFERLIVLADRHNATRADLVALLDGDRVWDATSRAHDLSLVEAAVWAELSGTIKLNDEGFAAFQRELRAVAHNTPVPIEQGRGVTLLDESGACRLCGSTDITDGPRPSVYGGARNAQTCIGCGVFATTNTFSGVVTLWRQPACPGCSLGFEYTGPTGAIVSVHKLGCPEVYETDRYGRRVRRDRYGLRYVTEDGFSFYITDCCDASAKGSQGTTVCRTCYQAIDPMLGGLPHPSDD